MVNIRAVFFDLDDTLCDARTAFADASQAAFNAIQARHPHLNNDHIVKGWRAVHGPLFAELAAGRLSMAAVRTQRFRRLLADLGVPDDEFADEVDLLLGQTQLDLLTLFDDVAVLETLRSRGLHVGIITNGAGDAHPDSQHSKAAHLGLLERVDSFWVSDEIGYRKPDPRAFLPALVAIEVEAHEVLYVGDSLENDVVGANRAGLVSVLLLRSGEPMPQPQKDKPRFVVRSLTEMPGLVDDYSCETEWQGTKTFGKFDPEANYVDRRAAYAIILRGETVAVVGGHNGKYFLPGGGSLPGETAEATVLREIREELGCGARIMRRLGEAEQYFYAASDDQHYRMDAVFTVAEIEGETDAPFVAGEEELHWLPLAEAQGKLFHECHSWAVKMIGAAYRGPSWPGRMEAEPK